MTPTVVRAGIIAMLTTVAGGLAFGAQSALTVPYNRRYVYTVDVLCGFIGRTIITIHNPNALTVTFTKKGVPLEFGQGPTPPKTEEDVSLTSDWALLMGCDDIASFGGAGSTGVGNVVVDSKSHLDVSVVYTSIVAGGGIGETRGPVRIPATIVGR